MDETQIIHSDEILIGVAKLLDRQNTPIFSRKAIRDELCISPEIWNASYSPTLQGMRSDHPGGAPAVAAKFKNVFKQVSHGKHTLTEYGKQLLAELRQQKIVDLLRFLPLLEQYDKPYIKEWGGGQKLDNGAIQFPFPIYEEDIEQFILRVGQPYWSDFLYKPEIAGQMLEDNGLIQKATVGQFRTMLTFCVRGERFSTGHWAAMLESGKVQALLHRLQQLQDL